VAAPNSQITFKVSPERWEFLAAEGKKRGLSEGQFARELMEQALSQSLTGNHLDEFRELVGSLNQVVGQLKDGRGGGTPTQPTATLPQSLQDLPGQVARLIEVMGERDAIAKELRELRQQIAKMMAILHQYATGDQSTQKSAEFGRQIFDRK